MPSGAIIDPQLCIPLAASFLHSSSACRQGQYIGSVFVQMGQRVARIDARPSDAIALALGNALPIFVARKVLDAAGVSPDSLDEPERTPATTARPGPI